MKSHLSEPGHSYQEFQESYGLPNEQMERSGYIKKVKPQQSQPVPQKKKIFLQPGTPCDPFEQILSTTFTSDNGLNTYLIAKALSGPALHYASQLCRVNPPAKKPSKPLPEIPQAFSGDLGSHLYNYATITHEGMYRKSNEDKLTIYLQDQFKWFSIYDGHGGTACSQYMKEHLHEQFFALDWRKDIPNSLRKAFINAEKGWRKKGDNSGSCALVIFIYKNMCYSANLGDSRAILISQNGQKCFQVTKDHKPSNPDQQKRIMEAGGKIYQTTAITEVDGKYDMIVGPLRVYPGRLSTTRTFGDFQAKDNSKQGNDRVVICEPQISSFQIDQHDFIVLGSDGVWDRLGNVETAEILEDIKSKGFQGEQWIKKSCQILLQQSMARGSTDNISLVIVGLNDPEADKQPKKGNEHIKIMGSLNSNTLRKKQLRDKQNSYPSKLKQIDSRITEINRNANRLMQSRR